jgi:mRNA interferase MazF
MQKDFDKWNEIKKDLDIKKSNLFFKEWDIWWISIWLNIKNESCWKWDFFRRPVLILKKLSWDNFIWIPLSTKTKKWTWFVTYFHWWKIQTALLYQIRMFNKIRFQRKIWEIDEKDFMIIKKRLAELLNL